MVPDKPDKPDKLDFPMFFGPMVSDKPDKPDMRENEGAIRARIVLGWGTTWEVLRVLSAFIYFQIVSLNGSQRISFLQPPICLID